ncbi:MAG: glycosyltransferase family 2 protein [Candidatus Aminicenantes bacterium]
MEQEKVSFMVVNWNGRETVEECLDSILSQTYRNTEIIFVDNHSSDSSLDLVRKKYNIHHLMALDRNYGYARASNMGLEKASGEYLALVNNDAVLDTFWLEKALAVFQSDQKKRVGSVATKNIYYHQRNTIDTAGVEFLGFGAGWDYKGLAVDSPEVNRRKEVFGACATAALYRKEAIDRIGLFDPRYFIYFEDTELAFRLRLFGYGCVYEPEAVCYHHGGVKQDRESRFYIHYGRRNIEFLFIKNMQGPLLAKYMWSHFVYESILFLFFLFSGKGIPFLKAKMEACKNLGYLLEERKKLKKALIQAHKLEEVGKVEQCFFQSPFRGLRDKLKKSLTTYKTYMNLQ